MKAGQLAHDVRIPEGRDTLTLDIPIGLFRPQLVYHADWASKAAKRWCAKATLGRNGQYTAFSPGQVGDPNLIIRALRTEAGEFACVFAGFDFPIGIPARYAERAGISSFRDFLAELGKGQWSDFYSVCHSPDEISLHRPFYPDGGYKGRRKQDLLRGHDVSSILPLLRRCERGGNGNREACCMFWTLGGNQVGKAAITGWRNMLAPALLEGKGVSLWPFDGPLSSLLAPGHTVVAETYPAECYRWFSKKPWLRKRRLEDRMNFGESLLNWADSHNVIVDRELKKEVEQGFTVGEDDAFDAVVGLFGMLQVCMAQRAPGEPTERLLCNVEGWILGRRATGSTPASALTS